MKTHKQDKRWFMLGIITLISSIVFGHGDHGAPGSLPSPLYGGRVKEAEHKSKNHHEGPEDELFFEAKFNKGKLEVFPLILPAKDPSFFKGLKPSDLKKVTLKVELSRSKKKVDLTPKEESLGWWTNFDPGKERRFTVQVSALHGDEVKEAIIQLEKE